MLKRFFPLLGLALLHASTAQSYEGCKNHGKNEQGFAQWCCSTTLANPIPASKCVGGVLVRRSAAEATCSLSTWRDLPGTRWVCVPSPKTEPMPPVTPIVPDLNAEMADLRFEVDQVLAEVPSGDSEASAPVTASFQIDPQVFESMGSEGAVGLESLKRLLHKTSYAGIYAPEVRVTEEAESRFLSEGGRVHYVAVAKSSTSNQVRASLEALEAKLDRFARPSCRAKRLRGPLKESLLELEKCSPDSIEDFATSTIAASYSRQKFLALTSAIDSVTPAYRLESYLAMLGHWLYNSIGRGSALSIPDVLAKALAPRLTSHLERIGSNWDLDFYIIWAIDLTDSAGSNLPGLVSMLERLQASTSHQYIRRRTVHAIYRYLKDNASDVRGNAAQMRLVSRLAEFLERNSEWDNLDTLVWGLGELIQRQPAPVDMIGLLQRLAKRGNGTDTLAITSARELARAGLSDENGVRYDFKSVVARFEKAAFPLEVVRGDRKYVVGDQWATVLGDIASEARGLGRTLTSDEIGAQATTRVLAKVDRLHGLFEREEDAFLRVFDLGVGRSSKPLIVRIANNPSEYATYMDSVLGYGSNNGGMYMERDKSFYTYDRTPEQSVFTLDELSRHEFAHYLQFKYFDSSLAPHWWTESSAEVMVGLLDDGQVSVRDKNIVEVYRMGSKRLDVERILTSKSDDDFSEYHAGALFLHFLMKSKPELWKAFHRSIQIGAPRGERYHYVSAADNFFVRNGSSLESLDSEYQAYVDVLLEDFRKRTGRKR